MAEGENSVDVKTKVSYHPGLSSSAILTLVQGDFSILLANIVNLSLPWDTFPFQGIPSVITPCIGKAHDLNQPIKDRSTLLRLPLESWSVLLKAAHHISCEPQTWIVDDPVSMPGFTKTSLSLRAHFVRGHSKFPLAFPRTHLDPYPPAYSDLINPVFLCYPDHFHGEICLRQINDPNGLPSKQV